MIIPSLHPIIPTVDWRSNRHRLDEELLPSFADDQKASQIAGFSPVKKLPSRELVAPTTHHYVTDLKFPRPVGCSFSLSSFKKVVHVMSQRTPPARPSSPAPTADLAGKHLCINHFRTGSCSAGSSCRGIHLPDAARHSALREAAVKPAASDQVFSLDDVRKVVRQELFCAHRGRGRRGNGSERRRAGKQEYWVAEKRRRRVQASHVLSGFVGGTVCCFVWSKLWWTCLCFSRNGGLVRISLLCSSGGKKLLLPLLVRCYYSPYLAVSRPDKFEQCSRTSNGC